MSEAIITGWGSAFGQLKITNEELRRIIAEHGGKQDLTDADIMRHTGIASRFWIDQERGDTTATLGVSAAKQALAVAGLKARDLDFILLSTANPEYGNGIPNTASVVQKELGAGTVPAWDTNAACAGFIYALEFAHALIQTKHRAILIICSEVLSPLINKGDYKTALLFGDAAAAIVLERREQSDYGIRQTVCFAEGEDSLLCVPAGGCRAPLTPELIARHGNTIHMDGAAVFQFATKVCGATLRMLLERHHLSPNHVWVVPHQANRRIIEAAARHAKIPLERCIITIAEHGNTSSASIPLAMHRAINDGRLRTGDDVLLVAFGAGLTWGGCYLIWGP